jgi:nitroreductase
MSWQYPPPLELPAELSDEAVAQLLECLYELARYLESHYAAQLQRYSHRDDPRQHALWCDDDPPF